MLERTCCFTGHRPQKLPWGEAESGSDFDAFYADLEKEIRNLVLHHDVHHFITGMALGSDLYAAEIVLKLETQGYHVTLECAIPFPEQTRGWSPEHKKRYQDILSTAHRHTLIQDRYSPDCYQRRNRYMVEQSDVVLAIWSGGPGGTAQTVRYALEQGRALFVINPRFYRMPYSVKSPEEIRPYRSVSLE